MEEFSGFTLQDALLPSCYCDARFLQYEPIEAGLEPGVDETPGCENLYVNLAA